jgi:hypothetical protein
MPSDAHNNNKRGLCKFEGCENEIRHKELQCCYTCYAGLRYWRNRNIHDKRARLQQIVRLNSRMEYMVVGSRLPAPRKKPIKASPKVVQIDSRSKLRKVV